MLPIMYGIVTDDNIGSTMTTSTIISLAEAKDVDLVGGKAAALGMLIRSGLPVPNGFVVSVVASKEHSARAFQALASDATISARALAIEQLPVADSFRQNFISAWNASIRNTAAVRSSATVEDNAKASFAGQFLTVLKVSGAEAALNATRACWASLWSKHADAYGAERSLNGDEVAMGVIVQEFVDPDFAGVAFSEDPLTGTPGVYYAEWVRGSGESLVSGTEIGGRAWFDGTGRVLRADYLRGEVVLDSEFWVKLAQLLDKVCRVCGDRQDIEFAVRAKEVVLLQARPITTPRSCTLEVPPPWRLAGQPAGGWSERQRGFFDCWDEYNPPQVEPLHLCLWMGAVWQASLDMLDSLGPPPRIEASLVVLDSVPIQVDPASGQDATAVEVFHSEAQADLAETINRGTREVCRIQMETVPFHQADDRRLLDTIASVAAVYREMAVTRLGAMQQWIEGEARAMGELERLITPLGVNPSEFATVLSASVNHETHRMLEALHALASLPVAERAGSQWTQHLDEFLRRFGHFESEGVHLNDARGMLLEQVERLAEEDAPNQVAAARTQAQASVADLRKRLQTEPDRAAFDAALAQFSYWIALREDTKTQQNVPRPLLTSLLNEAGRRLCARRLLSFPSEVTLLNWSELTQAFAGIAPAPAVLSRRQQWLKWKSGQSWLPDGFFGDKCVDDAPKLHGLSGSAGVVIGVARCVASPDEFGSVQTGDIVIARATNPLWTQLFSRIAAIVVENGSRLSHAAIVAREFQIPAIVSVPGVTRVIRNGERLRVDGTHGVIDRLDLKAPGTE